ncbi:MAG: hypothetical protein CR982_06915 [Candidatus Cloacimonadota bacterium]|nr:MAG: hypothetical protein CR982_06915 [Candidatus Cloacimonadota bacterium]PIE77785.1 MAG: hypothetical protein CSA15_10850 [Candidatus Delongbacteria bacterium]
MIKQFSAKVSYTLLGFVFLVFYTRLIYTLIKGEINKGVIAIFIFLTLIFAFILHLFFKTRYTIEGNILKIKSGIISYKPININEIKEISKTNNIISSPAPSFDRIEIKYGKFDEIIISPKDKLDFVNEIKKINPNIKSDIV